MTTPAAPTPHPQAPWRVLVVDGDAIFVGQLGRYLLHTGLDVETATNAADAWEVFLKHPAHMVVLDMALPSNGALGLLNRLRHHPAGANTRVLVLSGRVTNSQEEGQLARSLQVDTAFRRPLALRELVSRMDALALLHLGKLRERALAVPVVRSRVSTPVFMPVASGVPAPVDLPPVEQVKRAVPSLVNNAAGLAGECNLPSLCAVATQVFERRLTGVLVVDDGNAVRRISFHDGLCLGASSSVAAESLGALMVSRGVLTQATAARAGASMTSGGLRFGEALLAVGLAAPIIVEMLEEQAWHVATQALMASQGTFAMQALQGSPVWLGGPRMDPVELAQRACLQLPNDNAAADILRSVEHWPLAPGDAFEERALVLRWLRPATVAPEACAARPSVNTAVQRVRQASPEGVRELLALVLSQAARLGNAPAGQGVARHGVLPAGRSPWREKGLAPQDVRARNTVAEEWVRSAGRAPEALLRLPAIPSPENVKQAYLDLGARLGPPALEDVVLGPARPYLDLLRARRDDLVRTTGGTAA